MTQYYFALARTYELIVFIRALQLIKLVYEIKTMRIILETSKQLARPILNLMAVELMIYYVFCLIGMFLFGGLVRIDSP